MWYTNDEMKDFVEALEEVKFQILDDRTKSFIDWKVIAHLNTRGDITSTHWLIDEANCKPYLVIHTKDLALEIHF